MRTCVRHPMLLLSCLYVLAIPIAAAQPMFLQTARNQPAACSLSLNGGALPAPVQVNATIEASLVAVAQGFQLRLRARAGEPQYYGVQLRSLGAVTGGAGLVQWAYGNQLLVRNLALEFTHDAQQQARDRAEEGSLADLAWLLIPARAELSGEAQLFSTPQGATLALALTGVVAGGEDPLLDGAVVDLYCPFFLLIALGDGTKLALCIQPVLIKAKGKDRKPVLHDENLDKFKEALKQANDIWCPQCCIQITAKEPCVIEVSDDIYTQTEVRSFDSKTTSDEDALVDEFNKQCGQVQNTNDCMELFVVNTIKAVDEKDKKVKGVNHFGGGRSTFVVIGASSAIQKQTGGQILAHETGHALGLSHDKHGAGKVMHELANPGNTALTPNDCKNVKNPLLTNTEEKCEPMPKGKD
jgi:hypothetical protein